MSFGSYSKDHSQKWNRVVQTAIKQWNCEAKLLKNERKSASAPPEYVICFYLFYVFFSIFLFFLICFFFCLCFPIIYIYIYVFKFFSVLEGNWINNFKYVLLCLIIFVYFLIASIIWYNLVLFILILIYYLLSLFTIFYFSKFDSDPSWLDSLFS